MADEWPPRAERTAPPDVARTDVVVGIPGVVAPFLVVVLEPLAPVAVLVDDQPVGVGALHERIHLLLDVRSKAPLVAAAVDRERRMAPVVRLQLAQVAERIEGERLRRDVDVVRQLGLDENARFVRRFEILGHFAVRVEAHKVEAGRTRLPQMGQMRLAIGRRQARQGIDAVVAEATQEVRTVVQVERLAAHLDLAHAEALAPSLDDIPLAVQKRDLGPVEVGMLRGPGAEVPKGKFERFEGIKRVEGLRDGRSVDGDANLVGRFR